MSAEYFNDQWRIPNNKNQSLVSNYSMEFNGTSDFVDASVASSDVVPSSQSSWTYSSWLYLNSTHTSYQCIFERGAAYPGNGMLVRENAGTIQVYAAATVVIFTSNLLPTDEWAHFALVYDISTNELTCYINNSSQTLAMPSGWAISGTLFYIGKRQNNINFWTGKMDQVSIFDYALPATGTNSVATLYGGGTAVTNPMSLSPAPVTYYQLGDQSVSTGPTSDYLVPNNSLQDYVFNFDSSNNEYIDLDNTNDFLNIPYGSFSFWFYPKTTTSSSQYLLSCNRTSGNASTSWSMIIQDQGTVSGKARINFRADGHGNNNYSGYDVNLNQWNHYVAVKPDATSGNTQPIFYINGQISTGGTPNSGPNFSYSNITVDKVYIGRLAHASVLLPFNGEFSNVSIFNTELSSTQVTTLYNNGSPAADISSLSPTAWYKLNAADTFNGTDWTITDYAGSNDGTSVNMTSANLVQSDLQQTSGYSPYALDFDGADDYLDCGNDSSLSISGDLTISAWVYIDAHKNFNAVVSKISGTDRNYEILFRSTGNVSFYTQTSGDTVVFTSSTTTIPINTWTNIVVTVDSGVTNGTKFYFNGVQDITTGTHTVVGNTANLNIGRRTTNAFYINGKLSNVALWNTNLSSTEITEIFNEGVPSNLNNFSGTAPVSWWQLGSNSSFNTNWNCLDEIRTNNAVSANMTNDDIVDGVGYSASGLGTSSIDIKGDAPYSSANGLSENMDVLDRTTDVPS